MSVSDGIGSAATRIVFLGQHLTQECGVFDVLDMNGSIRVGAVDVRVFGSVIELGLLVEEDEPDPDQ